jgi:hypothetical protein
MALQSPAVAASTRRAAKPLRVGRSNRKAALNHGFADAIACDFLKRLTPFVKRHEQGIGHAFAIKRAKA